MRPTNSACENATRNVSKERDYDSDNNLATLDALQDVLDGAQDRFNVRSSKRNVTRLR